MADSGLPDNELVTQAKGGNRDAFGQLADRYYRMVSILAYQKIKNRADAEDVVQEAFVRAYRALESLREAEKFGGWLYHIALKICLDHLRKRDRHDAPVRLDDLAHAGVAADVPEPSALETQEENTKVSDAIAALPDKYRIVITLVYIEKKSYKEIAEQLGEPDGTIANRIHRAMKMLRQAIGGVPAAPLEELEETES
ncbi:sigma-70 family RNA polymerase sigma factor [bacterium]|nr:sigma-70 family RNA polymerase sigma factor [bacterium]